MKHNAYKFIIEKYNGIISFSKTQSVDTFEKACSSININKQKYFMQVCTYLYAFQSNSLNLNFQKIIFQIRWTHILDKKNISISQK